MMGEYRNDTHRVLDWINTRDDHQIFDRFSIWNTFCGVIKKKIWDPVQEWSVECNCGTRMSFNVWKFRNEKQITMFLIRWSE
jgi:hypothetical protein